MAMSKVKPALTPSKSKLWIPFNGWLLVIQLLSRVTAELIQQDIANGSTELGQWDNVPLETPSNKQ